MIPEVHIRSIDDYVSRAHGMSPRHALFELINFSNDPEDKVYRLKILTDVYMILLKDSCGLNLKYGGRNHDLKGGSLMFFAPGQTIEVDSTDESEPPMGWGILFHPNFIRKTPLDRRINKFTFFDYQINESLHVSQEEREELQEIIKQMDAELSKNTDVHSETLITSHLELFLNYCLRYYDRQFITRSKFDSHIFSQFESKLNDYFRIGNPKEDGLPTVARFANDLNLSPNYLSDYLKKQTGKSASEHIQFKLIEEAKSRLLGFKEKNVSQVAYELGFEYASYFTKLFKKNVGVTPSEYVKSN